MRRLRILAHALVTIPIVVASSSATRLAAQGSTPPVAKTIARIDTFHGEVRTDNYFWIRNKSDPQVISYLEAEKKNALSRARFLIYCLAAPPTES